MTRRAYVLSSQELRELTGWASEEKGRLASRARAILLSAEGKTALRVASELGLTVRTVYKWRQRFASMRVAGLRDRARPGQPRRLAREQREEIVRLTVEELPLRGERWTIRALARERGVTQHQVRKIWAEHGLRPHAGRAALVDDAQDGAKGLRLLGLFVCPYFSVIALQLDSQGLSGRLGRRVPTGGVLSLRAILREAAAQRARSDFVQSIHEFAAFLARGVNRAERARAHLVFSAPRAQTEPRIAAVVAARPGVSASSKACLSAWADVVELWLEQAASAPREQAAVSQLAEAVKEHFGRSQARYVSGQISDRARDLSSWAELPAAFSWLRRDAVSPAPSIGLLSAQAADL